MTTVETETHSNGSGFFVAPAEPAPTLQHEFRPAPIQALVGIASDALRIRPPLYVSSILGSPRSWIPPYRAYDEFKILNLWRLRQTIGYVVNVSVPSIPRTPPPFGPPLLSGRFLRPTVILQRPDHIGDYTSFPDETWFLINGIMTDDNVAQLNAALVSHLFHRPVTLIQNATSSFLVDLFECAIGKQSERNTEPAAKAFPVVYDALKDPRKRRVVIIAHSQGTIIAANLLRLLYALVETPAPMAFAESDAFAPPVFIYPEEIPIDLSEFQPLTEAELAKLELYNFATCANELGYFDGGTLGKPVPWIEHFGNEKDIVARLGMQAPRPAQFGVRIAGPVYVRPGAWGHLLNSHYLYPLADAQRKGHRKGGNGSPAPFTLTNPDAPHHVPGPRLFDYLNGGAPES